MARRNKKIDRFDWAAGDLLADKYEVLGRLGRGWEGEVYKVREKSTGIDRAAKVFYPQRNPRNQVVRRYAKKLHRLRDCDILIQYHNHEKVEVDGYEVVMLISEYVEGEILTDFLKRRPGKRLSPFPAIHLLHALAVGMEAIHDEGEYHGDLHSGNVIVRRYGLGFDLKLVDMYHWGKASQANIFMDTCDMVRIFYDALGGKKHYAKQPPEVKDVICGLKQTSIAKRFTTAGELRHYLETLEWDTWW